MGYRYHYELYGFCGKKRHGISMEDGKYYNGLLTLSLFSDTLENCEVYVKFLPALKVAETM